MLRFTCWLINVGLDFVNVLVLVLISQVLIVVDFVNWRLLCASFDSAI